jgi:hypothetical protein
LVGAAGEGEGFAVGDESGGGDAETDVLVVAFDDVAQKEGLPKKGKRWISQDSPGRELPGLVILEYEGEEDAEGAVPGILKKMAALQK